MKTNENSSKKSSAFQSESLHLALFRVRCLRLAHRVSNISHVLPNSINLTLIYDLCEKREASLDALAECSAFGGTTFLFSRLGVLINN